MLFSRPLIATKAVVAIAICFSSASASATANPCATGMQGCVLPVQDVVQSAQLPAAEVAVAEDTKGFPVLAALLGVAALAALAYFYFSDEDNNVEFAGVSP